MFTATGKKRDVIYKTLLNDSMPSLEITSFEKQKAVSYLFCSYKRLLVLPLLGIRRKKKKKKKQNCRTLLNSHGMFELGSRVRLSTKRVKSA